MRTLYIILFLAVITEASAQSIFSQQASTIPLTATVDWGDFDIDGDQDALVLNSSALFIYKNNLSGTTATFVNTAMSLPGTINSARWIDINNDGYLDIFANTSTGSTFFISKKGASFSTVTGTIPFTSIIDFGDVDNDGDVDVLANGVYENKGGYKFESRTTLTGTKLVDFDDDGDLDIFGPDRVQSNLGGYVFTLYKYFYQQLEYAGLTSLVTKGSTATDIDGDGKMEFLAVTEYSTGYPTFQCAGSFVINSTRTAGPAQFWNPFDGCNPVVFLHAADFDNNGSVDVLAFNSGLPFVPQPATLEFWSKNAQGTYELKSSLTYATYDNFKAVDYNKDGKLDFSIAGRLFINGVSTAAVAPSAPQNLTQTSTGNSSMSFSWSQATDNNTPAKSLTYNLLVTRGLETFFNEQISADFKTIVNGSGNVSHRLEYALNGLPNGVYQWSVQSVDNGLTTSAFAAPQTFEIKTSYDAVSATQLADNFKAVFNETDNQYLIAHLEGGQVLIEFADGRTMQPAGKKAVINTTFGSATAFNVGYNKAANKYFVAWRVGTKLYARVVTPGNLTTFGTETLLYTAATTPDDLALVGENIPYNSTDGKNGLFWIERRTLELQIKMLNLSFTTSLQLGSVTNAGTNTSEWASPDLTGVNGLVLGGDVQYIPQYKSYALAWSTTGYFSIACNSCFPYYYLRGGYTVDTITKDGVKVNSKKLYDGIAYDPKLQYDPFNNNFFAAWKELNIFETNSGRDQYQTSGVYISQFELSKTGLITTKVPATSMVDTSSPGTPNLLVANPYLTWTPKRNEYILTFNTTGGVMYFQRMNAFDGSFLEAYQTAVTTDVGVSPKTFVNPTSGEFLLGWINNNEGRFKRFKTNKDAPPVITSFTPATAYAGDRVEITGLNFGRMPYINKVKFGTIEAQIDTVDFLTTKLRVVVPPGLTRVPVPISVTFDDQTATSTAMFENKTLHSVTGLDLAEGKRGNVVTLTGDRFATDASQLQIKFGSIVAQSTDIESLTATQIKVKIPQTAERGIWDVVVVIQGQEVAAPTKLHVVVPPVITNITAPEGLITCRQITITGKEFTFFKKMKIKFGTVPVLNSDTVLSSLTAILVNVPVGAHGNVPITVEIDGNVASSELLDVYLGSAIAPTSPAPPTSISLSNRNDDAIDVQLTIRNQCSAQLTRLWTKGISEGEAAWKSTTLSLVNNRADASIPETQFTDPIGLNLKFEIDDVSGDKIFSNTYFIHKNFTELDSTNNVPSLAFGGEASDYNIVSLPYQLSPNNIPSVFKDLVTRYGSDSSKWRLFHYLNTGSNPHYIENTRGLDKIEPGKGYWMIVRYPQEIFIDGAQAVDLSKGPFEITLQPGWNQIGNPYNFAVSWADVLSFNNNPANLEGLKVFANGAFQTGTTLAAFRGGFVKYNGTTPLVIKIPYTKTSSGREALTKRSSVLADRQWYVPLTLSGDILTNETLGIGMDPGAQIGIDVMDESRLPAFYNQLDVAFDGNLASSIVPTGDEFTWKFVVHNSTTNDKLNFRWDNTAFGDNDRTLYLFDVANERVINMRVTNSYSFSYPSSREFKLFYGNQDYIDKELVPEHVLLGEAYPNPTRSGTFTKIPFTVAEDNTHVKLVIYNMEGKALVTLRNEELLRGFYEISWDGNDAGGAAVSPGLYIYRLESGTRKGVVTKSRKLVTY